MTASSLDTGALLASAERTILRATLIFDVTDGFAASLGLAGSAPRPIGALWFSLIERDPGTKGAQPIDPPLRLTTITNPSGYELCFGGRGDGGAAPTPGSYRLRIDGDLYAPYIHADPVTVPTSDKAIPCPLQPGYAYPFAGGGLAAANVAPTLLRGVLQSPQGTGEAGATVSMGIAGKPIQYVTDATGQFVFVVLGSPPPPTAQVTITTANGDKTTLAKVPLTANATTVIPQTVLVGRVLSTVLGATVQCTPWAGVGVAPDGSWRIVLPLDQKKDTVTVSAAVPGQKDQQTKVTVTPGEPVIVPPFQFNP